MNCIVITDSNRFILNDPLKRRSCAKNIEGFIDDNGCFVCDSHRRCNDGRYYQIKRNGKIMLLHRYVYETYFHKIPKGLIVRHKCDNVLCVNPDHLELGTIQDNVQDAIDRQRICRGEKVFTSKLTEKDVKEKKINRFRKIYSRKNSENV